MAAVLSARNIQAAAGGCYATGQGLLAAGLVADLTPEDGGACALVADGGIIRDVWVGIRHQFLVGECDCADCDPQMTSEEYLRAAAAGHAEGPDLCAHAVAVALAAIGERLQWASAPAGHLPRYLPDQRVIITPHPPLDITTVFPELTGLAATGVRLHPRAGRPGVRDSSLGGPLLWPAGEPWPVCEQVHYYRQKYQPAPPDPPSPLIGVLQLYARDVPELPFPDGTDLLQVLWCPNMHNADPWWGAWPVALWRCAADVTDVLAGPPAPFFDREEFEEWWDPEPCSLHPERVTEYPDACNLPGGLGERVKDWDEETQSLYWSSLSTAPGTKAAGLPRWIHERLWPSCERGHRLSHLVTIATEEYNLPGRWMPDDDSIPAGRYSDHGLMLGAPRTHSAMLLFTCLTCPERPVTGEAQSMG